MAKHSLTISCLASLGLRSPLVNSWPDLAKAHWHLQLSKDYFVELLRIRYSSPLFRLPQAAHIKQQLRHHNTGPDQVSGDFST